MQFQTAMSSCRPFEVTVLQGVEDYLEPSDGIRSDSSTQSPCSTSASWFQFEVRWFPSSTTRPSLCPKEPGFMTNVAATCKETTKPVHVRSTIGPSEREKSGNGSSFILNAIVSGRDHATPSLSRESQSASLQSSMACGNRRRQGSAEPPKF